MHGKYAVLRGGYVDNVEPEWEMSRRYIEGVYYNDVRGVRRVGGQRRNGSEEVGVVVAKKCEEL